ncbi:MAG TPA: TetR/AcrR family transcriptional regulator [Candidatus Acidoferrum sp.]|nr:TetR/AcrR family transcriptional regulator [Candidatus Acidoferrum sp.]
MEFKRPPGMGSVEMRTAKLSDGQLFERLTDVFRRKGYDGASYADLMEATGLVKASLYHRFPLGKEEVVGAIQSEVDRQFAEYVLAPAVETGPPRKRIQRMARRLREFYRDGSAWCLLDTLTLTGNRATLAHAKKSMEFWVERFARVARDSGLAAGVARMRAEEAVATIEGALILARVMKNRRPFLRVLAALPTKLTR